MSTEYEIFLTMTEKVCKNVNFLHLNACKQLHDDINNLEFSNFIWNIYFLGLGFANFMASCFVGLYYNMIIAWTIYYFFASFTSQLPWDSCGNDFNSPCK